MSRDASAGSGPARLEGPLISRRSLAGALFLAAVACSEGTPTEPLEPSPGTATLTAVTVTPATLSIPAGAIQQFQAGGRWSDNSTGAVAVTWSATGGTITGAGVYTAGSTPGTFRVIGRESGGLADTTIVTITPPPVVTGIRISPASATVYTGGAMQFTAVGTLSTGSTATVPLSWSATGGTVSSTGIYTAGVAAGSYLVVAKDQNSSHADTALVTVLVPPPPGQYTAIAREDWNAFADKSALAGLIGVEGGLNTRNPALPATAFYDLIPDPLFGKVVRYHGGPQLNTADPNLPGRVATHLRALGLCSGAPASWWLAPNGCRYPTQVWVRQFVRFSTNWTPASLTGGQGAADYKAMFLRYYNSSARHEFKVANIREWIMDGGSAGITRSSEGLLPWNNVQSIDAQYGVQGYLGVDLVSMVKPRAPDGNCHPSVLPCPPAGDGEWYEVVMHHKTVGERGEFTQYIRQYTVGGIVSPGTWKINARYILGQPGQTFSGVSHYEMGVNRNRQYDEVMYHDWGPYEVVDGSQFPNPWGLPGG